MHHHGHSDGHSKVPPEVVRAIRRRGLPLVPRHGVRLDVYHGDGPRFVERFRAVWTRLPLRVRRRILSHWRRDDLFASKIVPFAPTIVMEKHYRKPVGLAITDRQGFRLSFHANAFRRMRSDVAEAVIAHELAHVYQASTDLKFFETGYPPDVEQDADDLAGEWGFSDECVDEWCVATRRRRGVLDDTPANFSKVLRRVARHGR